MFRLLVVKIYISIFAIIGYLPVLVCSSFIKKSKRAYFWRASSIPMIKLSFFLSGIKLKTKNFQKQDSKQNFIYVSNHPSCFDGFVLQIILGPKAVPVTAPLKQFPFLVRVWLRNMGAIDIIRDDIDKSKYKGANSKNKALHKALSILKKRESIIIFPEGHEELIDALYKFHTGPARLSFASGVPIQTIVLKDAHRVFSNNLNNTGKVVTVEFEKIIKPEKIFDGEVLFTENEEEREIVQSTTKEIEAVIFKKLPLRLVDEQRYYSTDTGVFVDIDLTLYRSLSQVDFLLNLTKKGLISKKHVSYVVLLFILEKIKIVSHDKLMNESIKLIAGWKVESVNHLVQKFFHELALPKLEYGLFAILEDHLSKGHRLVFVTEIIHPLAQTFVNFFKAEKAIDTHIRERGLTYTGEVSLLCRGEEKKNGVEEFVKENNLDLLKSYAYADSYSDIPFLSLVGHPTAVHPDHRLKKYAKENNFAILKTHI